MIEAVETPAACPSCDHPLGLTRGVTTLAVLLFAMIWQIVYLAIAIRRFHFSAGRRRLIAWLASAGIAVLVSLLNSVYLTAVQFAGVAFAIARL